MTLGVKQAGFIGILSTVYSVFDVGHHRSGGAPQQWQAGVCTDARHTGIFLAEPAIVGQMVGQVA